MEPKFGYKNSISSNLKEKIKNRCESLGLTLTVITRTSVKEQSKKDLFDTRAN